MKVNKVSEVVSPEVETLLVQTLKDVYGQHLPFMVELSPKERQRLAKLSPKYVDFVDKAHLHAEASPRYLPSYLPLEEFTKDMDLRTSLKKVQEEVKRVDKRLRDTLLLVESEAYQAARVFYKTAQAAAQEGDGVAELIVKDLSHHRRKRPVENGTDAAAGTEPVAAAT